MDSVPELSHEIVLAGGWNAKYARVLRIAQAGRAGVALVDGNSDGVEIAGEVWEYSPTQKKWECVQTSGQGAFGVGTHAARSGRTAFISGYAQPGQSVSIKWAGRRHDVVSDAAGIGFL